MPTIIMLIVWGITGNPLFGWLALGCLLLNRLVWICRR